MNAPAPGLHPAHRLALLLASALAVVIQLVVLYLPGDAAPSVELPGLDKAVHALVFAVPVWLLARLTGRVLLVAGIFAGQAMASEIMQARVIPGRTGDPWDLVADLIGIAAAVTALRSRRLSPDPRSTAERMADETR